MSVDVCVLFSFRGGNKAPIEPKVHAMQQVGAPFDMGMSYPSASKLEETEDISDESEDFSSDILAVLTLMNTVRWVLFLLMGSTSPSCRLWSDFGSF